MRVCVCSYWVQKRKRYVSIIELSIQIVAFKSFIFVLKHFILVFLFILKFREKGEIYAIGDLLGVRKTHVYFLLIVLNGKLSHDHAYYWTYYLYSLCTMYRRANKKTTTDLADTVKKSHPVSFAAKPVSKTFINRILLI